MKLQNEKREFILLLRMMISIPVQRICASCVTSGIAGENAIYTGCGLVKPSNYLRK